MEELYLKYFGYLYISLILKCCTLTKILWRQRQCFCLGAIRVCEASLNIPKLPTAGQYGSINADFAK